jgi:hypothetical protein
MNESCFCLVSVCGMTSAVDCFPLDHRLSTEFVGGNIFPFSAPAFPLTKRRALNDFLLFSVSDFNLTKLDSLRVYGRSLFG